MITVFIRALLRLWLEIKGTQACGLDHRVQGQDTSTSIPLLPTTSPFPIVYPHTFLVGAQRLTCATFFEPSYHDPSCGTLSRNRVRRSALVVWPPFSSQSSLLRHILVRHLLCCSNSNSQEGLVLLDSYHYHKVAKD